MNKAFKDIRKHVGLIIGIYVEFNKLLVPTLPNAIVYGSGKITIPEMSKAGFWLNLMFIILLTAASFTLTKWVFGVDIGVLPAWAL